MSDTKIGLGLSGGGYRAAAYHVGTLEALNDIKIEGIKGTCNSFLSYVNNYATVSGGSITGAYFLKYLGKHHKKKNSNSGKIDFKGFQKKEYTAFKKNFNKNILHRNCELWSIIINPILVIIPALIGFGWWLATYVIPELFPYSLFAAFRDVLEDTNSIFAFTSSIIAFVLIFVTYLAAKKYFNVFIFKYKKVSVICLITIIIFIQSAIQTFNQGIKLTWLMLGFAIGVVLITAVLIAISDMLRYFKLVLILCGTIFFLIIFILSVWSCFDPESGILGIIKGIEQDKIESLKIMPIVIGIFLYVIYFIAYLLFPTGFSRRKGIFLKKRFRKKEKFLNTLLLEKDMTINDLPDGINIGILTVRIEQAQTCVLQKATQDEGAYPLGDAVSKSCNFPPIFEPEEINKQMYKKYYYRTQSVILLDQNESETEESSISLSDGGSLDNHGVSVLANEKLDLFSKIILLSDSDPPHKMESAEKGFIAHLLELITTVLLRNVHTLNYYKYFKNYLNDNCGVLKPVFISLKDDIDTILNNYKDRARVYKIVDYLHNIEKQVIVGAGEIKAINKKIDNFYSSVKNLIEGYEYDNYISEMKKFHMIDKNKVHFFEPLVKLIKMDKTRNNDKWEKANTAVYEYIPPLFPGDDPDDIKELYDKYISFISLKNNKIITVRIYDLFTSLQNFFKKHGEKNRITRKKNEKERWSMYKIIKELIGEGRLVELMERSYRLKCKQVETESTEDNLAHDRFDEYDLAGMTDNKELFQRIGFPCDPDYYFKPGENDKDLEEIKKIPTRLIRIKRKSQEKLIKHSRTLTEFLVKFWIVKKKREGTFEFRKDIFILQLSPEEHNKIKDKFGKHYNKLANGQAQFKNKAKSEQIQGDIWKMLYVD